MDIPGGDKDLHCQECEAINSLACEIFINTLYYKSRSTFESGLS